MGVLDQVMQMKSQGVSDQEIASGLQQQGVTPKQINDALSQAQIKSAVAGGGETEGMQSSIMSAPNPGGDQAPAEDFYEPGAPSSPVNQQPAEVYDPQAYDSSAQEVYDQGDQSQQEYYGEGEYANYGGGGVGNTTTMIEVAEQVFSEKIRNLQKKIDDVDEFKNLAQTKIETISNRLTKIEKTIDNLQMAILEKIGSYGGGLESIKKEMSMMQDSFGKMVGHVVKEHTTKKKTSKKK